MNTIERILQYLEYKQISKYKFYKTTGLSNGFLDKGGNIGSDKCEIILSCYEDLNATWLITGKGEMLLNEETKQSSILSEPIKSYIKTTKDCEKCKEKEEYINILKDTIATQKKLIVTIENILLQHNISIYKVNPTEEETHTSPKKQAG